MEERALQLFNTYPEISILISLLISIIIAVAGIIPSVFITAANILFFGLVNGTLISFAGESLGAGIAFLLYRTGFRKRSQNLLSKYPMLKRLINANGLTAFRLIFTLRLIPFMPSGFVTLAAACGKVSFIVFLIASTLGKLPALLLEAYAVYNVSGFTWQGKVLLGVIGVWLLYIVIKKYSAKPKV